MKFYAGIGSRETPIEVCEQMTQLAMALRCRGWICRTGGAKGADTAFMCGAGSAREVYLPWERFNGWNDFTSTVCGFRPELEEIAARHHPKWGVLRPNVKRLHTRNVAQILGWPFGEISSFVLCWTSEGTGGGGTGQAIRVARSYGVPVYDMARPEDLENFRRKLNV